MEKHVVDTPKVPKIKCDLNDFDQLELSLENGMIKTYFDVLTQSEATKFHKRLFLPKLAKIYVLKDGPDFLYVGATMQSLSTRIRYGLTAKGKNGYHGYKWKGKEKVQIAVWSFAGLTKHQVEAIEAELVLAIRAKTGMWPLHQNEIHFNNELEEARSIAAGMVHLLA